MSRSYALVLALGAITCVGTGCAGSDDAGAPAAGAGGGTGTPVSGGTSGTKASGGSSGTTASGGSSGTTASGGTAGDGGTSGSADAGAPDAGGGDNPLADPDDGPPAGNPGAACSIPAEAALADSSHPDQVVGDGTPESCTGAAVVAAVAAGGVITFDCGDAPITIKLSEPAKVFNDASDKIVIDGGGKVTLSGGGTTRILYMNTCDQAQHWTTDHCDDQPYPELTVQNITFVDGNAKAEGEGTDGGGGAIWERGGRFKLVNTRFFRNVCADTGPDVGGAVRVFSQSMHQPVYVVNSTFGGADGFGNTCSNGGGISSIDVSWTVINSLFSYTHAIGNGGNPADAGTPGGGSGGAIYNDGNTMTLSVCGSLIEHNDVKAYGSAIFFVSNNMMGTLRIHDSVIRENTGGGWNVLPGISMHDTTVQDIQNSTIE